MRHWHFPSYVTLARARTPFEIQSVMNKMGGVGQFPHPFLLCGLLPLTRRP